MKINTSRVLANKKIPKVIAVEILSPVDKIEYITDFKKKPMEYIIENLDSTVHCSQAGVDFFKHVVETTTLPVGVLEGYKAKLLPYSASYGVKESINVLNKAINSCDMYTYVAEQMIIKRLTSARLLEGSASEMLRGLTNKTKTTGSVDELFSLIDSSPKSGLPALITQTTNVIVSDKDRELADKIISIPTKVVGKIIDSDPTEKEVTEYIKLINLQLGVMYDNKEDKDVGRVRRDYIITLKSARDSLNSKKSELLAEACESIADMQPDIIVSEDDVERRFEDELVTLLYNTNEQFEASDFTNIMKLTNLMTVEEGKLFNSARKTSGKVADKAGRVAGKVASFGKDAARIGGSINRIPKPFVDMFNRTIDSVKELDSRERRERMITGQFRFKLWNFVTRSIAMIAGGYVLSATAMGASVLVGPCLWAIGAITAVAIDKNLDLKEKKKILNELEDELSIVNEKIEDSRGDTSKKSKYELMRIKNKLEKDIERIKYHL